MAELATGGTPGPQHSLIRLAQSRLRQKIEETSLSARGMAGVAAQWDDDLYAPFLTSRSSIIAAGTTEILKNVLAERVLDLPRE